MLITEIYHNKHNHPINMGGYIKTLLYSYEYLYNSNFMFQEKYLLPWEITAKWCLSENRRLKHVLSDLHFEYFVHGKLIRWTISRALLRYYF